MRVPQTEGSAGSLKWIQRAVNDRPFVLQEALHKAGFAKSGIEWRSPLRDDAWAEYRDDTFLEKIGHKDLADALGQFWPARGPQWDALAVADDEVLLVEAKAHIRELLSPPSAAGNLSLARIDRALDETARALGAKPLAPWSRGFYQLANRLAFLHFLTVNGVAARLVLVNFVADEQMHGPTSEREWRAAYEVVFHVLGLGKRHPYVDKVLEIFPEVTRL